MPPLKHIITLALSLFLVVGCDDPASSDDVIAINELTQEWTHSWEEDGVDIVQIYRPGDSQEFPAARYRQEYTFEEDGKCEYLVLASNDGHYFDSGSWTYAGDTRLLSIVDSAGQIVNRYEIVELTNSILRMIDTPVYGDGTSITVPVDVDVLAGFAGYDLSIEINWQEEFADSVYMPPSLAGPLATFSTTMRRGPNLFTAVWQKKIPGSTAQFDTLRIRLGGATHYYFGLDLLNDSLTLAIREIPFLYL